MVGAACASEARTRARVDAAGRERAAGRDARTRCAAGAERDASRDARTQARRCCEFLSAVAMLRWGEASRTHARLCLRDPGPWKDITGRLTIAAGTALASAYGQAMDPIAREKALVGDFLKGRTNNVPDNIVPCAYRFRRQDLGFVAAPRPRPLVRTWEPWRRRGRDLATWEPW